MWHTIAYVSTVSPDLTNSDIKELLAFSKHHNNQCLITGILMFSDGNFFQVLEGEQQIIKGLFEKIKTDVRHYDVFTIFDRSLFTCNFSKYHCVFLTIFQDEYSRLELQNFLKNEKDYNPQNYNEISYLTRKFMKL